jgi:hypothetical protein
LHRYSNVTYQVSHYNLFECNIFYSFYVTLTPGIPLRTYQKLLVFHVLSISSLFIFVVNQNNILTLSLLGHKILISILRHKLSICQPLPQALCAEKALASARLLHLNFNVQNWFVLQNFLYLLLQDKVDFIYF